MITEKQKYRLGFFLLLMAGSVVLLVLLVFGRRMTEKKAEYYILFQDTTVSGLRVGSSVSYQGLDIGTVKEIHIDPQDVQNIIVTIEIDADVPMRKNTKAALIPAGITGSMRLEMSGGEGPSPTLAPGSVIPADLSTLDFVTQSAEDILSKIDDVLEGLSGILSEQNKVSINNLLENTNRIIIDNQKSIAGIVTNLELMTEDLRVSMQKVNGLLVGLAQKVNDAKVVELTTEVQKTISDTNEIIQGANEAMASVNLLVLNNERDIIDAIDMLRRTAESLYDFSLQINDNPALLLRSR